MKYTIHTKITLKNSMEVLNYKETYNVLIILKAIFAHWMWTLSFNKQVVSMND